MGRKGSRRSFICLVMRLVYLDFSGLYLLLLFGELS